MLLKKAELMYGCGLQGKAMRQAVCRVMGVRLECSNTDCRKRYFRTFACRNCYCPHCGPKLFGELLGKHLRRLSPVVDRMIRRPGYVVAKIDFTTINLGVMPTSDQVKEFNACIKRFVRALEKKMGIKRKDYGLVYTDEFGGEDNTNLHAHGAYVGPVIPRQWCTGKGGVLSEMWRKACDGTDFAGSFIVSLKAAKFEVALSHSLKYAGKFLSNDPQRLAALEIAFHSVKRVHSMGVFYNVPDQEGERDASCPSCGSTLRVLTGYVSIAELAAAGFVDLGEAQREAARARGFGCSSRGSPIGAVAHRGLSFLGGESD